MLENGSEHTELASNYNDGLYYLLNIRLTYKPDVSKWVNLAPTSRGVTEEP